MNNADRAKEGLAPYCSCRSGLYREAQYDGYGIFLTYTCRRCEKERMSRYREDIYTRYDADEAID